MIDIAREIESVGREVGTGRLGSSEAKVVRLQRTYDAAIADVWNALTTPERISRWFLPISGDLRLGGHYQFEGNAGGEILECDRPNRLKVTWVFGPAGEAPPSEVVVRLAEVDAERTRFDLEHTAVVPDEMWDTYGPGAVGVGWDSALLGLDLHISTDASVTPETAMQWMMSDEGKRFIRESSDAWRDASIAFGTDAELARASGERTRRAYSGEPLDDTKG